MYLADRMKTYEGVTHHHLTRRTPVIIRVDGRAFHSVTAAMDRPFDRRLVAAMVAAASALAAEMQGCRLWYHQSDEISFLLLDTDKLETEPWFGNDLSKVLSISASFIATELTHAIGRPVQFDARAFNIPVEDVTNYFLWRARDWARNSLQMYAQAFFSHRSLLGKDHAAIHEMLHRIGRNWAEDLPDDLKNGTFGVRAPGRESDDRKFWRFAHPRPTYAEIDALVGECLG